MSVSWLIWICVGYLSGSVPFGLLIGLARGVDIRKSGSGNVGATNTGRQLGRKWGVLCFVLDVVKGLGPVLACGLVMGYANKSDLGAAEAWRWLAVAAAAICGHIYPVWLGFKGGKGVATSLGVLLGFWPLLTLSGLVAAAVWLLVLAVWRYVGLASVVAAILLPLSLLLGAAFQQSRTWADQLPLLVVTSVMALLVVVRHRGNLQRIAQGSEPKIGSDIE